MKSKRGSKPSQRKLKGIQNKADKPSTKTSKHTTSSKRFNLLQSKKHIEPNIPMFLVELIGFFITFVFVAIRLFGVQQFSTYILKKYNQFRPKSNAQNKKLKAVEQSFKDYENRINKDIIVSVPQTIQQKKIQRLKTKKWVIEYYFDQNCYDQVDIDNQQKKIQEVYTVKDNNTIASSPNSLSIEYPSLQITSKQKLGLQNQMEKLQILSETCYASSTVSNRTFQPSPSFHLSALKQNKPTNRKMRSQFIKFINIEKVAKNKYQILMQGLSFSTKGVSYKCKGLLMMNSDQMNIIFQKIYLQDPKNMNKVYMMIHQGMQYGSKFVGKWNYQQFLQKQQLNEASLNPKKMSGNWVLRY